MHIIVTYKLISKRQQNFKWTKKTKKQFTEIYTNGQKKYKQGALPFSTKMSIKKTVNNSFNISDYQILKNRSCPDTNESVKDIDL